MSGSLKNPTCFSQKPDISSSDSTERELGRPPRRKRAVCCAGQGVGILEGAKDKQAMSNGLTIRLQGCGQIERWAQPLRRKFGLAQVSLLALALGVAPRRIEQLHRRLQFRFHKPR